MSRLLFVFRPEPGLSVTLETAGSFGLNALGCALFEIQPVEWQAPDAGAYDGLLVGSSNAFRDVGPQLELLTSLPVYAVGDATAEAAREKGFIVSRTGKGGLQSLLDDLAGREMRLLRLAGESRVELTPPAAVTIENRTVYRTVPLDITPVVSKAMREQGGVALLHSGEAAARLAAECTRLDIDRSNITIAALGPRIAKMAGDGWKSVEISKQTSDAALLAMAQALCQSA